MKTEIIECVLFVSLMENSTIFNIVAVEPLGTFDYNVTDTLTMKMLQKFNPITSGKLDI